MKILNLYCGIGGNRKFWGDEHEVVAVEFNPSIAKIYQDLFPNDKVIVGDAHQYLLEHFKEFDFIWSSPPCPTHSRMNFLLQNKNGFKLRFPDMKLYEEMIFLKQWFKGKWVVENVRSYYNPLIKPQEIQSHYFWSNFDISNTHRPREKVRNDKGQTLKIKMEQQGIFVEDFHGYDGDKRTLLNNCIEPRLGLHILNCATKRGVSELKLGKAQSLNKDLKVQSPTSPKLPSATSPNPNIQSKKNKFEILPPSREKLL